MLENHMEELELVKEHYCEVCNKQFYLKWRLKKHMQRHAKNTRVQHCHYFNNNKDCPFISVGCMFKHVKSGPCIDKSCSRKLCQFEHLDIQEEDENILDVSEEGHDDYMEVNEKQCHPCRQQFGSKDDQIDHVRRDHIEFHEGMMEFTAIMKKNEFID